ncbi:MAG: helix-turn-helix domain-containing protein [Proteobacteria bacterium]|nr:helix-turn-helix domain-containing protein [Pseudomonadota bacterium]
MLYRNEREIAKLTGISLSSLRNNRSLKRGLPYIKIGKSIRYNMSDVINYLESHRIVTKEI